MPDQDRSAKLTSPAQAGEFDFDLPTQETPRVKRRTLRASPPVSEPRPVPAPLTQPTVEAAPPVAPVPATSAGAAPGLTSQPISSSPRFASTVNPSPAPAPADNPHGTRPATLYYTTGPRKNKEEDPTPMKTTSSAPSSAVPAKPATTPVTATPAASTAATPASGMARPTVGVSTATRPASTTRPAGVVDYRANVERQAREQKSVGNVLSIVVYTLIGLFVLSAILAGYGAFAVSKQLQQQSLTIGELDKHYAAETQALTAQLKETSDALATAQAQLNRQQDLLTKQQDTIGKLIISTDQTAGILRQERQLRSDETSSLRTRVHRLESAANNH